MPMLSFRSPGSRYQDGWQLLGRFLYTSSPPELPAGPDTMVAICFVWVKNLWVVAVAEDLNGGDYDIDVSLTGKDNGIYTQVPLCSQVHALLWSAR